MRRADHRGSWAGHGRLSQADLLQLPPRALAPPRRRQSARESPLGRSSACSPGQIQVQVSKPHRPVPTRGRRAGAAAAVAAATGLAACGAKRPTCGSRPPRGRLPARSGANPAGLGRDTASFPEGRRDPCVSLGESASGNEALGSRGRLRGQRSPETLGLPHPRPPHASGGAPRSLDLPPLPGHAPRPRLAQFPSWANFLTPSGKPLSLRPKRVGARWGARGSGCFGSFQAFSKRR